MCKKIFWRDEVKQFPTRTLYVSLNVTVLFDDRGFWTSDYGFPEISNIHRLLNLSVYRINKKPGTPFGHGQHC